MMALEETLLDAVAAGDDIAAMAWADLCEDSGDAKPRARLDGWADDTGCCYKVRWCIRRDMAEILKIERESQDHPWEEGDFLKHLREMNCIGMVAEAPDETIHGLIVYLLHTDCLELVHLCGINGACNSLVAKLASKLSGHRRGRACVMLEAVSAEDLAYLRRDGWVLSENGEYLDRVQP